MGYAQEYDEAGNHVEITFDTQYKCYKSDNGDSYCGTNWKWKTLTDWVNTGTLV